MIHCFSHTIKGKLFFAFFALIGAVFLFQFIYIAPTLKQRKIEEIKESQKHFASLIAEEMNSRLNTAVKELEAMALLPGIVSLNKSSLDDTIITITKTNHFFNYFFVMDNTGKWLSYPSRPDLVGQGIPMENMGWIERTFKSKGTVSLNVVKSKIGTLVSGFSTPILNTGEKATALIRGVFIVSDMNFLVKTIKAVGSLKGNQAYLVASNGWLIAHSHQKLNYSQFESYSMIDYKPVKQVLAGEIGVVNYSYHGKDWIAAFHPVGVTDWGLIVQRPLEQAILEAKSDARIIVFVILACFFIGLSAIAFVVQNALNPLFKLVKSIQNKSFDGDSYFPKDEIGNLAYAFKESYEKLASTVAELKTSEKKYRELIENSNDAIFIAQNGIIIFSNDQTSKLLGYNNQILQTTPFLEFIHLEDRDMVVNRHIQRLSGEENLPTTYSFRVMTKNKTELTVQLSTVLVEWNDKPATLNFLQNITEQKQLEEIIIQNEKMLSLGGLSAGMAHEINNPLAGILQNTSAMSNRLTNPDLPGNVKAAESLGITIETIIKYMNVRNIPQMLQAISDSGSRMASIVENMLSFARKGDASFSSHDPVDLMEKTLELANTDYNFKSIIIQKEYTNNLPIIVCEGGKIQQVLLNIFNNGAYAMFHKNRSEGDPPPKFVIRIFNAETTGMLQFEIEDNGIGMDKKTASKIFNPFYTTKPVGEGTGLGLSVSYFIVTENHKGSIDVSSEPGKGTKFIIRLPIHGKTDER